MTLIELIILKYALAPLALFGSIVSALALRLVRSDLRAVDGENINGGKRYTTLARMYQSAILLSVSVVLLIIGAVFWLSPIQPRSFYVLPQVLVERIGLNVIATLLLWKEWSVRQTRIKLDKLYDEQQKARRGHRRASDPPDVIMSHLREQ